MKIVSILLISTCFVCDSMPRQSAIPFASILSKEAPQNDKQRNCCFAIETPIVFFVACSSRKASERPQQVTEHPTSIT